MPIEMQVLPNAVGASSSADDYLAEDEDMATMGALLLAMRHNGPNRHSNRSTASSSQSSEESALSAGSASAAISNYQVLSRSHFFFIDHRLLFLLKLTILRFLKIKSCWNV